MELVDALLGLRGLMARCCTSSKHVGYKSRKIGMVADLSFANAQNSKTVLLQHRILAGITLAIAMPVLAVYLKGYGAIRKQEIYRGSAHFGLLFKGYAQRPESFAYSGLYSGFASVPPPAGKVAEDLHRGRPRVEGFATMFARAVSGGLFTGARAVMAYVRRAIDFASVKRFAAVFASDHVHVQPLALHRADGVAVGAGTGHREGFATQATHLIHPPTSFGRIPAILRAKAFVVAASLPVAFTALIAVAPLALICVSVIASGGAIRFFAPFDAGAKARLPDYRGAAVGTWISKRHGSIIPAQPSFSYPGAEVVY